MIGLTVGHHGNVMIVSIPFVDGAQDPGGLRTQPQTLAYSVAGAVFSNFQSCLSYMFSTNT